MWLKIKKVIDRLHLKNHKNPDCAKNFSAEPLTEIYPNLNTMVAEQTFTWASRYKKIRFLFYYHRMVVRRNRCITKCYKANRYPVLPKVTRNFRHNVTTEKIKIYVIILIEMCTRVFSWQTGWPNLAPIDKYVVLHTLFLTAVFFNQLYAVS